MHAWVRVKLLNDNAFLLYFDEFCPSMSLYEMLPLSFEEWITEGEIEMVR